MKNIHYFKKEYFLNEMKFFNADWLFVCLKSSLAKNNSFVTLNTFYHKIVVQNFRGKLVALSNICVHRFNTLQNDLEGVRPLICDYHSWGYDKFGKTRSHESACLEKYEVGECGDFIFINISKKNIKLIDYLGGFYNQLVELSSLFDNSFFNKISTVTHNSNWKFLVENVLECYHCQTVHSVSLGDIGLGLGTPFNHELHNRHDSIEYPVFEQSKKKSIKGLNLFKNRDLIHASYKHYYIAPNLFISSTEGLFFYIGRLDPLSKNKTNLQVMFRMSLLKNDLNKNIIKHYYKVSSINSINVIKEDQIMVQNQQKNMKYISNKNSIFTKDEPRIINFHKNLNKSI